MKTVFYAIVLIILAALNISAQDLSGTKICIDPGHGGHEGDDRYIPETGFWESESNLTKAFELERILKNLGADVLLTRYGNNGTTDDPSPSERKEIANEYGADYFNSIHSNGYDGTANYTLTIYNGHTNSPTNPLAQVMAEILAPKIYAVNRTTSYSAWGDLTLNPTWTYGYGVLYGANMPATITEGSFHDYIPESWRLQCIDYRKHEAWAIARSFLEYFEAGSFSHGIIGGIIRDSDEMVPYFYHSSLPKDQYAPINNAKVTLLPDNIEYFTDTNNNGFYFFDSLAPGTYQIIVEKENYPSDTSSVEVTANQSVFSDVTLINQTPPFIAETIPELNDTTFSILDDIFINFSRSMNTASVESTLVITPKIGGWHIWKNSNKQLMIRSDSLTVSTNYSITISGNAEDNYGHKFDGNKDGVGGDDFVFTFKTDNDIYPPVLTKYYPSMNLNDVERRPIIRLEYDEKLIEETVTPDVIKLERFSDKSFVAGTFKINTVNKQSIIHFFPEEDLFPGEIYVLRIYPGLQDLLGNETTNTYSITFITGNYDFQVTNIDNFNSGLDNWWGPTGSGSNRGVDGNNTYYHSEQEIVNHLLNSTASMKIHYGWLPDAGEWLLREYLAGGAPRAVQFNDSYIMQAYVFGDGSGNKIRFAVDDDIYGNAEHEVSPWYQIDWSGWKLVSWDMSIDGTGEWIGEDGPLGDGSLSGTLRYDSFQLTFIEGAADTGTIYFDDLRFVRKVPATAIENDPELFPKRFQLSQNYPNPFNPETVISYQLSGLSQVSLTVYNALGQKVRILVNRKQQAGSYSVTFNAEGLASGVYYYKLVTGNGYNSIKKMILAK